MASKFIWGIGFHWYSGDSFEEVEAVAKAWPNKHMFATEACNCPGVKIDVSKEGISCHSFFLIF
jgi:glucosylceramidase